MSVLCVSVMKQKKSLAFLLPPEQSIANPERRDAT